MKKWIARLIAVLTAGMCLCTGLSLPAAATDAATLQQYETEVLIQVNRERAAYGLDPLYTAASIQLAAENGQWNASPAFPTHAPTAPAVFRFWTITICPGLMWEKISPWDIPRPRPL